jgi:hypothetical protein
MMGFEGKRHRLKEAFCIRHGLVMLPARVRVRGRENLTCPSGPSLTTCLLEYKKFSGRCVFRGQGQSTHRKVSELIFPPVDEVQQRSSLFDSSCLSFVLFPSVALNASQVQGIKHEKTAQDGVLHGFGAGPEKSLAGQYCL